MSTMAVTAAEARPAKCLLDVGGTVYIDGPCDFEPDRSGDGSFMIMAPDAMYFAYLNVEAVGSFACIAQAAPFTMLAR